MIASIAAIAGLTLAVAACSGDGESRTPRPSPEGDGAAPRASGGAPEPAPGPSEEGGGCEELGARDRNPADRDVPPSPGKQLLERRGDGRLPAGFNDHAALAGAVSPEADAALHATAGSTLWRFAIDWRAAEPTPDGLELDRYDAIYCAALERGIRPLIHLTAAPEWAADAERRCTADACLLPPAREHDADFRELAEQVAIRYPRAAAIEIWNEPNLEVFWADPEPDRYVEVLRAGYTGVKNGAPAMPVLGGSLSNTTRTEPGAGKIAGTRFAEAMYEAGAARHMDAVSFHPYPIAPLDSGAERFTDTMRALRGVLGRHGESGTRIWVTEVGLPARPGQAGPRGSAITPEQQADTLISIYRRLERAGDVDAALFHTLIAAPGPSGGTAEFGWLVPAGEGAFAPRPVYCRLAGLLAEPIDCDAPLTP